MVINRARVGDAVDDEKPTILLTGPMLGGVVGCMLCCTTFLYINHDRENKQWINATQREGHWPPPSGDFNWCEPDYVFTPWVVELLNSITSCSFIPGPILLSAQTQDPEVRLNLALVAAIGLGSVAFHATLQYEAQLLDELPMICYIVHTTVLLYREDVRCPLGVKGFMVALCALLLSTGREALPHKAGRLVMVLGFSGCFVWLAFSLARVMADLDRANGGYSFANRYQYASLTVVVAIGAWVTDNLACQALHQLPFGLPYPQLHATVWHTGMAVVCHSLCRAVLAKTDLRDRTKAK